MLRIYLRSLSFLAPERSLSLVLVVLNFALAQLYFVEPLLFGRVIDAVVGRAPERMWRYIALWAAAGLAGIGASAWVALHADRLAHRRRLAVVSEFFSHALELPASVHSEHHSGKMFRILYAGSTTLFSIWLGFLRDHLSTILSILAALPLAFLLNKKLALLIFLLMVLYGFSNTVAIYLTHRAQRRIEDLGNRIAERTSDVISNVTVVQSFSHQDHEKAHLAEITREYLQAQYPVLRGWAWLFVSNRTASTLTILAIFGLGAWLCSRGELTVGELVTFVGFATSMIGRLDLLASFVSALFTRLPSLRDFFAILDIASTSNDLPGAPDLQDVAMRTGAADNGARLRGDVTFQNVSFTYADGHAAIRDVSVGVPAGSTVAIVGPTGAGKTTLLSLLYRAQLPDSGTIAIDGIDIRTVTLRSVRNAVAVVFQESALLYRTIADNLRLGQPAATYAQLEDAARIADAHDFILKKPEGYDTLVAEKGQSLSGGERQRLAIARALLKDAPILILDEATSALDNITESRVKSGLAKAVSGRTTFIVAHRLSTVLNADLILVLQEGKLVEQGGYSNLIKQNGLFASLVREGKLGDDPEEQP